MRTRSATETNVDHLLCGESLVVLSLCYVSFGEKRWRMVYIQLPNRVRRAFGDAGCSVRILVNDKFRAHYVKIVVLALLELLLRLLLLFVLVIVM